MENEGSLSQKVDDVTRMLEAMDLSAEPDTVVAGARQVLQGLQATINSVVDEARAAKQAQEAAEEALAQINERAEAIEEQRDELWMENNNLEQDLRQVTYERDIARATAQNLQQALTAAQDAIANVTNQRDRAVAERNRAVEKARRPWLCEKAGRKGGS